MKNPELLIETSGRIEDSLWLATGNLNARKFFYHIRSLDPAVNRREYVRYPLSHPQGLNYIYP